MRLVTAALLIALASSGVACLRNTEFRCTSSAECGPGGTCQISVGYCSVVDSNCSSSQRYGDSAGSYAGQCVGGGMTTDASSSDAPPNNDAPLSDAPSVGCPSGYTTIPNGQAGHLYRMLTPTANWSNQRDMCTATSASAYLAIPDDAAELAALSTFASSTTQFWIGVSDQTNEGQWRNTKNAVQTFLPWDTSRPNTQNNNQDDCVLVNVPAVGTSKFRDDRCSSVQLFAICECEP